MIEVTELNVWCPRMDILLNKWFTSYDAAKNELKKSGGYLLPYKQYFYITTEVGISELGMDPKDQRWSSIGHDWVHPKNVELRDELIREIKIIN